VVDNISVRAQRMATATPASRNRYADFLRALAILAVVFGHWLMAAVWVDETGFHTANVLGRIEATQWLYVGVAGDADLLLRRRLLQRRGVGPSP